MAEEIAHREEAETVVAAATTAEEIAHYEEIEIVVPGFFVVLQGNNGDGLSNTIDGPLPVLPPRRRPAATTTDPTPARGSRRRPASAAAADANGAAVVSDASGGGSSGSNDNGVGDATGTATSTSADDAMIIDSRSETSSPSSMSSPEEDEFQHIARTTAAGIVNGPRYAVTAGVVAAAAAAENSERTSGGAGADGGNAPEEFVVVEDGTDGGDDDDNRRQPRATEDELAAIEEWTTRRREHELRQRADWEESLYQVPAEIKSRHSMMVPPPTVHATNDPQSRSWWQRGGEVAVLRDLPTKLFDGSVAVDRIGTMAPGTTVMALDVIELDSATLRRARRRYRTPPTNTLLVSTDASVPPIIPNRRRTFPRGRLGIVQMIKVETAREGRVGYACLSLDGYPLLAPGLPDRYVNPAGAGGGWIWRVTCPSGAFVREGLDLRTLHIRTLPYGSLVRVTRRCINLQGLSRLRTSGCFDLPAAISGGGGGDGRHRDTAGDAAGTTSARVDGWCSELLNPLSGQRGIVAQPLPFPVAAIYRVTLAMGAVIRQDVELSSPQTGLAPFGTTLKVVARAFSEHPVDKCIERLKLAGDGGWISVRLNLPPPLDDLVVELVTIDPDFDPENPGLYHLNARKAVRAARERERTEIGNGGGNHPSDLSSIDETELSQDLDDFDADPKCAVAQDVSSKKDEILRCVVCLTSERNATIVHGETGHIVCCLVCARILKARGDKCPVCRTDIEKVIQHFYA